MKQIDNKTVFSDNQGHYLIMEEITLESCKNVIEYILEANLSDDRPSVINLFICSPGGDFNASMAVVDIIRGSSIPVRTIGLGQIASAALIIFLAGTKGCRILTPNTSILSHQFSSASEGKRHELLSAVKEFNLLETRMIAHYKKCTNLSEIEIKEKLLPASDIWLSSEEALVLGLCDEVKNLA